MKASVRELRRQQQRPLGERVAEELGAETRARRRRDESREMRANLAHAYAGPKAISLVVDLGSDSDATWLAGRELSINGIAGRAAPASKKPKAMASRLAIIVPLSDEARILVTLPQWSVVDLAIGAAAPDPSLSRPK